MKKAIINFLIKNFKEVIEAMTLTFGPVSISFYFFWEYTKD